MQGDIFMFIDNKYKRWYDSIIKNAKTRTLEGYKERHHVLPRCMGGSNKKENIANLTAREHFICHWLLTKFVSDTFYKKKMLNALGKFVRCSNVQERNLTSRQFEAARKAIAIANTGRHYTKEMRQKMSEAGRGRIPWNKGMKQPCTEERKKKLSETLSGRKLSKEWCANISKGKKGKPSGMLGKTHSEETRELMSKNMKGKRGPQKRIALCPNCEASNVTARHIKFCYKNKLLI